MKATSPWSPLTAAILAILISPCPAQESPPQTEPEKKAEETQDPEERYAEAKKEYDELIAAYEADAAKFSAEHSELLRKRKKEEADQYRRDNRPTEKYIDAFLKGAQKYDGSKGAALFLGWLVSSTQSNTPLGKQAIEILFEEHLDSLEMRSVITPAGTRRMNTAFGREGLHEKLKILVEKSPYEDEVRAPARFILAQSSLVDPKISEEDKAAALAELRLLAKEQDGTALAKQATAIVFQSERLQVGMVAPDISGSDLNGRSIRLSDFRGQIVLLEFWADSVTACRASYTHLKSMHKTYAPTGRFAYLGINCDENINMARRAVDDNSLPWRSIWNGPGGMQAGQAQIWNLRSLPTNYVIDTEGVIRSTTLRGLILERSIAKKLIEIGALPKDALPGKVTPDQSQPANPRK